MQPLSSPSPHQTSRHLRLLWRSGLPDTLLSEMQGSQVFLGTPFPVVRGIFRYSDRGTKWSTGSFCSLSFLYRKGGCFFREAYPSSLSSMRLDWESTWKGEHVTRRTKFENSGLGSIYMMPSVDIFPPLTLNRDSFSLSFLPSLLFLFLSRSSQMSGFSLIQQINHGGSGGDESTVSLFLVLMTWVRCLEGPFFKKGIWGKRFEVGLTFSLYPKNLGLLEGLLIMTRALSTLQSKLLTKDGLSNMIGLSHKPAYHV